MRQDREKWAAVLMGLALFFAGAAAKEAAIVGNRPWVTIDGGALDALLALWLLAVGWRIGWGRTL